MITKIRSIAKGIGSKILMGLLVLTFGVWGVGDMLRRGGSSVSVASVGDASIPVQEYAQGVYRETEKLKSIFGDKFTPEMAKNFGTPQRVLQQLIDKQLLIQEARAIGRRIGDADVVRNIHTTPAFQDDKGNFSKPQFENMLKSTGQSEKEFVQKMRDDIAVNILITTLTNSITPPKNAATILLAARGEQRNIELYILSSALVKTLNSPTDEQLKAYYDAHAAEFATPEYRKISFVEITEADSKKTIQQPTDKEIEAAYLERSDEFQKSERRKVEQLLFGNEESAKKAYAEIIGGKSLEDVGKTAHILNPTNISLGIVEQSGIPEGAAEKVFALKKGEVTTPVKSAFGWHIFRVSDVLPAATQQLAEVHSQIIKDLEVRASETALTKLSNNLEDAIASGSNLAEAAKELGLKTMSLPPIDKDGRLASGEIEKSLPAANKFLETVFNTDAQSESQLITGKGGIAYVVRVESVIPKSLRGFSDIKNQLTEGWIAQEKNKQLADIAKKIAGEFASQGGREKAIRNYGLAAPEKITVSRSKENTNKLPAPLIMDVFNKPINGASEAFLLPSGSYAIAVVNEIIPVKLDKKNTKTEAELADINKQYTATVQNEITDEYLRFLAKKYKISVNTAAMKIKSEE